MSSTGQALKHARYYRDVVHDEVGSIYWLHRAVYEMQHDVTTPGHIEVRVNERLQQLTIHCGRCGTDWIVDAVSTAADFRDRHYYCRDSVPAWRCQQCDRWAFGFEDTCRFCQTLKRADAAEGSLTLPDVLEQQATYELRVAGKVEATVTCRSLLRATRAARAMFPRVMVRIVSDFVHVAVGQSSGE